MRIFDSLVTTMVSLVLIGMGCILFFRNGLILDYGTESEIIQSSAEFWYNVGFWTMIIFASIIVFQVVRVPNSKPL